MYDAVDYGKKGVDFTVAMPRFKLKGKPDDLTRKVADLVSRMRESVKLVSGSSHFTSSRQTLGWSQSRLQDLSCISRSIPLPSTDKYSAKSTG